MGHGSYTDEHVARCSQLGGSFGRDLEQMLLQNVGSDRQGFIPDCNHVSNSDVRVFLNEYQTDRLWDYLPGRVHEGFADIKHEWKIRNPAAFAKKMSALSEKLDLWQSFTQL